MNENEFIFELLSSVLTAIFEKKVIIKYADKKIRYLHNGSRRMRIGYWLKFKYYSQAMRYIGRDA